MCRDKNKGKKGVCFRDLLTSELEFRGAAVVESIHQRRLQIKCHLPTCSVPQFGTAAGVLIIQM